MRTFHHDLHFISQVIHNIKSLSDGRLRLLVSESIKSLEDALYFFVS